MPSIIQNSYIIPWFSHSAECLNRWGGFASTAFGFGLTRPWREQSSRFILCWQAGGSAND